jgi:hypothetical protein
LIHAAPYILVPLLFPTFTGESDPRHRLSYLRSSNNW